MTKTARNEGDAMSTKYLSIKEIVRSVSETHSFNKERLLAVNTSDVENGNLLEVAYMPTSNLKGQFKKTIKQNDILFSEIRPANRRFALVKTSETSDYVVSTKLMVLRKYNDDVDLDYFYYCLTNQPFLEILQRRAENRICSFPQITFDLLGEYKFPIPPLEDQKCIARIIRSIDDKIENNRAINRNLPQAA
jgi:type I restriction enzyme S subunit